MLQGKQHEPGSISVNMRTRMRASLFRGVMFQTCCWLLSGTLYLGAAVLLPAILLKLMPSVDREVLTHVRNPSSAFRDSGHEVWLHFQPNYHSLARCIGSETSLTVGQESRLYVRLLPSQARYPRPPRRQFPTGQEVKTACHPRWKPQDKALSPKPGRQHHLHVGQRAAARLKMASTFLCKSLWQC